MAIITNTPVTDTNTGILQPTFKHRFMLSVSDDNFVKESLRIFSIQCIKYQVNIDKNGKKLLTAVFERDIESNLDIALHTILEHRYIHPYNGVEYQTKFPSIYIKNIWDENTSIGLIYTGCKLISADYDCDYSVSETSKVTLVLEFKNVRAHSE